MTKRKKATFTVTRNESVFLWEWYIHNRKYFDAEDIYVLNHQTTDGSVQRLIDAGLPKENVIDIDLPTMTCQEMTDNGTRKHAELLNSYEWVIYAETNEFVFPDITKCKNYDSLLDDLKSRGSLFRCLGYCVLHDYRHEPALVLESKPWLRQRSKARIWRPEYNGGKMAFSKPICNCKPVLYRAGQHDLMMDPATRRPVSNIQIDERFVLIHCHLIDTNICEKRRVERGDVVTGTRVALGARMLSEFDLQLAHAKEIPEMLRDQF